MVWFIIRCKLCCEVVDIYHAWYVIKGFRVTVLHSIRERTPGYAWYCHTVWPYCVTVLRDSITWQYYVTVLSDSTIWQCYCDSFVRVAHWQHRLTLGPSNKYCYNKQWLWQWPSCNNQRQTVAIVFRVHQINEQKCQLICLYHCDQLADWRSASNADRNIILVMDATS